MPRLHVSLVCLALVSFTGGALGLACGSTTAESTDGGAATGTASTSPTGTATGTGTTVTPGKNTTYVVAPSGNDANPGTAELPFATLQKAADVAGHGQHGEHDHEEYAWEPQPDQREHPHRRAEPRHRRGQGLHEQRQRGRRQVRRRRTDAHARRVAHTHRARRRLQACPLNGSIFDYLEQVAGAPR